VLVALGGLTAWTVATDASQSDRKNSAIAVGVVYGLPGLLMAVTGGAIWFASKGKARGLEDTLMPVARTPPDRAAYYPPPWPAPTWSPPTPAPPGSKPPIRLEAEPIPPPAPPPQADPPSFTPAPPAPESAPELAP
jgi:hypothetical protein